MCTARVTMAWKFACLALAAGAALATTVQIEDRYVPKGGRLNTLYPAIHWDHDVYDLKHLVPNKEATIYYTAKGRANPRMSHQFGHVETTLYKSAVILEHSAHVKSVSCSKGGLTVNFATYEGYKTAKKQWPAKDFFLATHTANCGKETSGQHAYWAVDKTTFAPKSLSATVLAKETDYKQALHLIDVQFGQYQPDGRPAELTHESYDYLHAAWPKDKVNSRGHAHRLKTMSLEERAARFQKQVNAAVDSCTGIPPTSPNGLPTAPCNAQFDETLDNELGYLDFNSTTFGASLQSLAPGLGDYNPNDYIAPVNEPPAKLRRYPVEATHMEKRWGFFSWISRVVQKVVQVVKAAVVAVTNTVTKLANAIADGITSAVTELGNIVVKIVDSLFNPSFNANLSVSKYAPNTVPSSPFGPAFLIARFTNTTKGKTQELSLYCVKCGFQGQVAIFGRFSFNAQSGSVSQAQISALGSAQAGVTIGIDASYTFQKSFEKMIAEIGFPGFTIPKIITVGPVGQLKATLTFKAYVAGQVQAGATATIGPFDITIDLQSKTGTNTRGFDIAIKPVFTVSGQVSASATLGLPLSLGFGIVIPIINFEKTASLIEEPTVQAIAIYDAGGKCIDYGVYFQNFIRTDIFGLLVYDILTSKRYEIVRGCIAPPALASRNYHASIPKNTTAYFHVGNGQNIDYEQSGHVRPLDLSSRFEERDVDAGGTQPIDNSPNGADFQALSKMAQNEAAGYENMIPDMSGQVDDFNFTFTEIYDSTGQYKLSTDDLGDIRLDMATADQLVDGGLGWRVYEELVVSDYGLRILHYYTAEIAYYNVSRFRLADAEEVPMDSRILTLQSFDIAELAGMTMDPVDPLVYLAVDPQGNVLFPITCSYLDGSQSKVFLTNDMETGPVTLANPGLQSTITGGPVDECNFIPYVANGGPGMMFAAAKKKSH